MSAPPGDFEVAIISPGISASAAAVQAITARGIPVVSELELGWSRATCRVLAITGSNGKSTLVKLCAEALAQAGQRVVIAGNYGVPVAAVVSERRKLDWLVLEVSSFQLETVQAFRPDVGVLLNVTPNHLDRHGDLPTYRGLKARLFARMTAADTGIVEQAIMPEIQALAHSSNRWIVAGISPTADCFYQSGAIHNSISREKIELRGTMFDNEIMGLTAAAAMAALSACGVAARHLVAAARAFKPLPHRMQALGAVRGIRVVNDSKATNLAAMLAALTITPAPIRLIAGGLPKRESYEPARELLASKVTGVYLIGQAAEAMAAAWRETLPCIMCGTLEQAVATAWKEAKPGETILLSPACASFDQFHSFEERGERFSNLIQRLA
ncbi:MAG: UDP-N-acetylmuramoyl-L-alanine--D-glutamate ligase [Lentisphaerae bacterium]|nr:UDP-N-acetylmuramoyl-L-alanine--D-glutamate ligase [Lentisphaerota bacterium]